MKALLTFSAFRHLSATCVQQLQSILRRKIKGETTSSESITTSSGPVVMKLQIEQLCTDNDDPKIIEYNINEEETCDSFSKLPKNYENSEDQNGIDDLTDYHSINDLIVMQNDEEDDPNKYDEYEVNDGTYTYSIEYDDTQQNDDEIEMETDNSQLDIVIKSEPIIDLADTVQTTETLIEPIKLDATSNKGKRKEGKKSGERELCPDCGGFFISLKNHLQTHRDKTIRKCYTCDICNAKFVNKASYVGHVNKHNNLTPFQCPKCDKSFHGKGNLRMHMNSHSTTNRYVCQECNKAFRYSHMLALHRRSHTLERVYFCEHCSYCSVNRENYKNHMVNHTGIYRFNCDKCSKGFKKKLYYLRHMKIHEKDDATELTN